VDKREFLKTSLLGFGGLCLHAKSFPEGKLSGVENKYLTEAQFYTTTPKGVRCHICPSKCNLGTGEIADCRNRVNINNKLYSISYGNPCAVHLDPIEKLPLHHFLPSSHSLSLGLAGCNFTCLNCQNWTLSQAGPNETENFDYMPDKVIEEALSHECKSIAFTYTEPTTYYEYVYDTSILARSQNIKSVFKTNGYINEKPLRKLCKVIDAANVDLKTFSNKIYPNLTSGALKPVLNSLKVLKEEGVWLEITNLVIPSWTDDLEMIKRMCAWLAKNGFDETPLHFGRFIPEYRLTKLPPTPLNTLIKASEIASEEGLSHVYVSGIPGNDISDTHCPSCNRAVIERKGYIVTKNNVLNNQCSYCGTDIKGVWE